MTHTAIMNINEINISSKNIFIQIEYRGTVLLVLGNYHALVSRRGKQAPTDPHFKVVDPHLSTGHLPRW